jgi:hypothetical protein
MRSALPLAAAVLMGSILGAQGRGAPPGLEPRIVSFEAKPAAVRAGQPVLLVWHVENPTGVSIEPGIGAVTARGSRQVTPSATTTYTLTAKGAPPRSIVVTVDGTVAASANPASAASTPAGVRRMPDGKPDLTGVYGNAGLPQGTTPPPLKPGAEKYRIVRGGPRDVRGRTTITTGNDCYPLGVPQTYITPYPFQIVHLPKMVIIIYEYPNAVRFVPIDGRPQVTDPDPSWMGTSVGRWDGDTLVIDTTNFVPDHHWIHDRMGIPASDALHIVERIRMMEGGKRLEIEFTLTDPKSWVGDWKMVKHWNRVDDRDIAEVECLPDLNQHMPTVHSGDNVR